MEALLYCCCGLDVHKDIIEACILRGEEQIPEIIRKSFSTTPKGLKELVEWTDTNDCYSVAMESTGVYWTPVFEAFERNAKYTESLWVVNAHNMRNLPGRKSDTKDAEWIATLLRHGLLEKSFVPSESIRTLRGFTRLRRTFIQEKARYLNRLEKFLQNHGFKFSSVMSNIYCKSGRELLFLLRDKGFITEADVKEKCHRLRHPDEEIYAAVCGTLKPEEQCLLKHLLDKIEDSQDDIDSLNADMRLLTAKINDQIAILTSIPGISEDSAVEIIAEISDVPQEHFSSAEKLCSWAGLSPRNDESAGTIKSRKIMHGNPYIKAIKYIWGRFSHHFQLDIFPSEQNDDRTVPVYTIREMSVYESGYHNTRGRFSHHFQLDIFPSGQNDDRTVPVYMKQKETFYTADRNVWRKWLEENFETKNEIWFVFPTKESGEPALSYNDAVEEALCFGWIDSTTGHIDEKHGIRRFTPRKNFGYYSRPNIERLIWLDRQGLIHPKIRPTVVSVMEAEFIFPEDILNAIRDDEIAWKNYQEFSEPYKRIRIAYIDAARKRPEEFEKRLNSFLEKTRNGKMIVGFGGIEKYYV